MATATKTRFDNDQAITNKIIELLESGNTFPWQKPWSSPLGELNALTGKAYQGGNLWILALSRLQNDFQSSLWIGMKQGNKLGLKLNKGSKATYIQLFSPPVLNENGEAEKKGFWMWKPIFNLEQFSETAKAKNSIQEIIAKYSNKFPVEPSAELENLLSKHNPEVVYGGSKACYSPTFDKISMPLPADFHTKEGFAATLLHELAHWTGHSSRLNRDMTGRFGTPDYAYEELVAELSSAQLCGRLGINPQIENHASYIASWLTKLKNDKSFFLKAAKDSQKVVDFLIDN
jgi:antirestriction protein ArdC